jgi:hypothetical protein
MTRLAACLLLLVMALPACGGSAPASGGSRDGGVVVDGPPADACVAMFGRPTEATGLTEAQCRPACGCGGEMWTASEWPATRVAALGTFTLADPPAELTTDPYEAPAPPPVAAGTVCAVEVVEPTAKRYRLRSFATIEAATAAGATPTHGDGCGLCSSLHDLAVYASMLDLGEPVRACGIQHMDIPGNVACLEALGFSRPCAQIWAYNTRHTRQKCLDICLASFLSPYNASDGSLNPCLECDERESGPVFKAVAGRTRRNTGIPNAICRPCAEVIRLAHDY